MAASQIRQNLSEAAEKGINNQINIELGASYVYQSIGFYFDRDDVALPGFAKLFHDGSKEEREHAEELMKYMNKRGGRIVLQDVRKPSTDEWGTGLEALEKALAIEKKQNEYLLDLHKVATENNDPHLCNFLESEFLNEQAEEIEKIGNMITRLKRTGAQGIGEYIFDKELQGQNTEEEI